MAYFFFILPPKNNCPKNCAEKEFMRTLIKTCFNTIGRLEMGVLNLKTYAAIDIESRFYIGMSNQSELA